MRGHNHPKSLFGHVSPGTRPSLAGGTGWPRPRASGCHGCPIGTTARCPPLPVSEPVAASLGAGELWRMPLPTPRTLEASDVHAGSLTNLRTIEVVPEAEALHWGCGRLEPREQVGTLALGRRVSRVQEHEEAWGRSRAEWRGSPLAQGPPSREAPYPGQWCGRNRGRGFGPAASGRL